jgi:hypothetical protein
VALDSTKIHADASRHSALSSERAAQIEMQLYEEVSKLTAMAEAADQSDWPDGMSISEALARREKRPAEIAWGRAVGDVVQAPNDKQQVQPMLEALAALPGGLGQAEIFWQILDISAKRTSMRVLPRGSIL